MNSAQNGKRLDKLLDPVAGRFRLWKSAMFNLLQGFRLNTKIALLGAGSVLVTAIAMVALAMFLSGQYNMLAQKEVDSLLDADLDHLAQGIYNLVRTENEAVQSQLDHNLNIIRDELAVADGVRISPETITWRVSNQLTNEKLTIELPVMLAGGRSFDQNSDPAAETAVVDRVTRLAGVSATIFQRMNTRGDMLRVATTVRIADGKRATGTYVAAVNPDGTANPVITAILKGKSYHGRAFVVNEWCLTAYEPLRDKSGKLVGMLFVGIPQKTVEARVRQAILETNIGNGGYVYVLGGKGKHQGHYIISQGGKRDGEDILGSRDSDGRLFIKEIIDKAPALRPGELATERYRWQNPGEREPRWKVARLAYYAPWDWVIGVSVYEDKLQAYRSVLHGGRLRMMTVMSIAGLVITFFFGLFGTFIAWSIGRPVHRMKQAVETVIQGDLEHRVEVHASDEVGALAASFNVMTERLRKTIEGLRASDAFTTNILESIDEGFVVIDREYRIISANRAYCEQMKIPAANIIGKHCYEIVHHQTRPCFLDGVECAPAHTFKTGIPCTVFHTHRDSANNPVHIEEKSYPVKDAAGEVTSVIETLSNISEKRRLEEQLRHAQKMEAIGTLAGGIAHDFNNLLNVIIGYGGLMQMRMQPDDPNRPQLQEMLAAGERAAQLTRGLLLFSRKEELTLKLVDVNEVLAGFRKMLGRIIGEDVELRINPSAKSLKVMADSGHLEQVLMNLAANARDAMPGGGVLDIETGAVVIDRKFIAAHGFGEPGEYSLVSVSDNGNGMDEQTRERIFEPYFTTKEIGRGTGLGLSIVFGIVRQHKGMIRCYSEPGKGTTFRVYLPLAQQTEGECEAAVLPVPEGGTETVLVAEDDPVVRTLTRTTLENFGYRVIEAVDGADAVHKFREYQESIALIIMDLIMPVKNGKEAYEDIKEFNQKIKVVFMSGYTADFIKDRGMAADGLEFISKPMRPDDLLRKVRDTLDSQGQE